MKARFILTILVMQFLMFSFALQPAMGISFDSGGAEIDEIFGVDTKAKGTKVGVTLTLYYEDKGSSVDCAESDVNTDMHYFLRVSTGKGGNSMLYPFAGISEDVCLGDAGGQKQEIQMFILYVVQQLFPGELIAAEDIKVKNVDNIVTDNEDVFPGCCVDNSGGIISFLMVDVDLAITRP